MEVDTKKHERPEQSSQNERQELPKTMDCISVSERYDHADNQIKCT